MASTYLQRTQSGTETNSKKATISAWVKLSGVEGDYAMGIFGSHVSGDFNANGNGQIGFYNSGLYAWWKTGGSTYYKQESTRKFRDVNSWYHIVYRFDTTQTSGDDRIRVYLNGEEVTSWVSTNDPPVDANIEINNSGRIIRVGAYNYLNGTFNYLNGSMSHYHFCDGYSYGPTEFGETDSTTGEWKIKTSPSVSYGTNGFFILKDGNTITDQSPNSNDFSLGGGTLTDTKDCPSNVVSTINKLFANSNGDENALTNGNNTYTSTTRSVWNNQAMTLGAATGKYYWEVKYTQLIDSSTIYMADEGVASTDFAAANLNIGEGSRSGYAYGWLCANRNTTSNTRYLKTVNGTSTLTTDSNNTPVAAGDIVGIAWDATNGKLWFHKNGTYIDDLSGYVGNPSSGTYPYHTGMQTGIIYTPWADVWQNASGSLLIKSYNFGNGTFGTTNITTNSGNGYAGAEGASKFNYQPPTGYSALSTKGINA